MSKKKPKVVYMYTEHSKIGKKQKRMRLLKELFVVLPAVLLRAIITIILTILFAPYIIIYVTDVNANIEIKIVAILANIFYLTVIVAYVLSFFNVYSYIG